MGSVAVAVSVVVVDGGAVLSSVVIGGDMVVGGDIVEKPLVAVELSAVCNVAPQTHATSLTSFMTFFK
jgi:hypothetical protein